MNRRIKSWYWLLRAELEMYYHYSWSECLFGSFLFIGILVSFGSFQRVPFLINQDPLLHGPVAVDAYVEILRNISIDNIITVFNIAIIITAFILPIILSNSLAGPVQNGFMKTLVSYPVSRNQIILSKILVSSLSISVFMIIGCSLPIVIFTPVGGYSDEFIMMVLACFITTVDITSTTILVSLLTSSQLSTSVLSSGGWLLLFAVASVQPYDSVLRVTLNPILLVTDFIHSVNPALLFDHVILILGVYVTIAILATIVSLVIFGRKEL